VTRSILITGAGGQVGHELAIADCQHKLVPLSRDQLDITVPEQVEDAFATHHPGIVINAAAYTQVDRAEQEPEFAFAINRDGVANLASACKKADIPLLHVSTDYVFDGSKQGAYLETDPIAPLGIYGESKAEGEAALRDSLERHIILRTSWVFSSTGNNFVKTMLRLGKERAEFGIVDDQHGCPTSARSIARALLNIANQYLQDRLIEWGTYHYCNQPKTTWFGFAAEIFERAGGYQQLRLKRIASNEYLTPATRPKNSELNCTRIETKLGIKRTDWIDELESVLEQCKTVFR
jgi:dTDP-4-dehydrorhamnose reductase